MSIRKPNPTQAAGILRRFLKDCGIELQHTAALEAVARASGYSDWQAMAAQQKRQAERDAEFPPLLQLDPKGDDNSDFVYVDNPHNKGAWVTIGGISVYLKPTDEGVVVDLFASGAEDRGSEVSTYLFYQEALDALCDNLDVEEEAVAQWAHEVHGLDFSSQTPGRKTELVKEYAQSPQERSQPDDEDVKSDSTRFLHGEWEHIFGLRAERTRLVFDHHKHVIVYMELHVNQAWRQASPEEIADVQDSLLNANEEALAAPENWGLTESEDPPAWARAFILR